MRVSAIAARSIAVNRADLHSSSTTTIPTLRDLVIAPLLVLGEAEAVAADDRAVLDDHAVAQAAALADLHGE